MPKTIVVLGARNLGGAILSHHLMPAGAAPRSRARPRPWRPSARLAGCRCRPTHPIRTSCAARWSGRVPSSDALT